MKDEKQPLVLEKDWIKVEDMEYLFHEICIDKGIDPIKFCNHYNEIKDTLLLAFKRFTRKQDHRAKRFKPIYQELDRFSIEETYRLAKEKEHVSDALQVVKDQTMPILSKLHMEDPKWIIHPNFDEEYFDVIKEWMRKPPSSMEKLLEGIKPDDDTDGDLQLSH